MNGPIAYFKYVTISARAEKQDARKAWMEKISSSAVALVSRLASTFFHVSSFAGSMYPRNAFISGLANLQSIQLHRVYLTHASFMYWTVHTMASPTRSRRSRGAIAFLNVSSRMGSTC